MLLSKNKSMGNIFYLFFSIALLFPVSIIKIGSIKIPLFYFYFISIPLFFIYLLKNHKYINKTTTSYLWLLRFILTFLFTLNLLFTDFNISASVFISFFGFIGSSFLYEIIYLFHLDNKKFIDIYLKVFNVFLLYSLIVILKYDFFASGRNIESVRNMIYFFPNSFSILLVINFWIKRFYEKNLDLFDFIIVILLLLSLSRTGVLIFFITGILYYFKRLKHNFSFKNIILFFIVIILLLSSVYIVLHNRNTDNFDDFLRSNFKTRFRLWIPIVNIIKDNMILGLGFERTSIIFNNLNLPNVSFHNIYLEILFKIGVVGFFVISIYVLRLLIISYKINFSLFIILIIILVSGFFQNVLTDYRVMFYLYYFIIQKTT
jgi:O-antigen ligase